MEVNTASRTSCEVEFSKGLPYIVYAESGPSTLHPVTTIFRRLLNGVNTYPGRLFTTQCYGSKPVQDATQEIRFMEAFVARRTNSSIQGEVYAETGQVLNNDYEMIQRRLTGSVIIASSVDGIKYKGIANSKGKFQIEPIRAGRYKVTVQQTKFRSELAEYDVDVPEGGCGVVHIAMGLGGSVSDRLRGPQVMAPIRIEVRK